MMSMICAELVIVTIPCWISSRGTLHGNGNKVSADLLKIIAKRREPAAINLFMHAQ